VNRSADWLAQAERDLEKARIDRDHAYYEWACFTAQQAAEKAVKALGMSMGLDIWGHAVSAILRSLRQRMDIPEDLVALGQSLDAYYIPSRYPNGFDSGKPADYYNAMMADGALNAAGEILRFCKKHLS